MIELEKENTQTDIQTDRVTYKLNINVFLTFVWCLDFKTNYVRNNQIKYTTYLNL